MSKKSKNTNPKDKLQPTGSTFFDEKKQESSAVSEGSMLFGKRNFMFMLGGIALIGLGMLLMSGGHMTDPNVWDEDVIYSTRRTLIAPIVILAGLGVQFYAIFAKK